MTINTDLYSSSLKVKSVNHFALGVRQELSIDLILILVEI